MTSRSLATMESSIFARFKTANSIETWILNRLGMIGLTMPWGTVYLHPDHATDEHLWRHEAWHLHQIVRDGPLTFSVRYLWHLAISGYRANPYEIEAYANDHSWPPGYGPEQLI